MFDNLKKPLFILEMANNHMGDIQHGLKIINEFRNIVKKYEHVFQFAFKLQLRDKSIIHPDYVNRMDLKNIKRFTETRLSSDNFAILLNEIKKCGFISMCTPFDEVSVDVMKTMDFDIFKIASCSFADWPLMEAFSAVEKPIIVSSACAKLSDIDKVVSFFKHRKKDFCLMHCVSSYPTRDSDLEINQIDFLKNRYSDIQIGFSTHENPECLDSIKIAVAKGSMVFEKHVGIPTENYQQNAYSVTPEQVDKWLEAAERAFIMCGGSSEYRMNFTNESKDGISPFVRGCFLHNAVKKGEKIKKENIFLAIPNVQSQLTAMDMSKFSEFEAQCDIEKNQPLLYENVSIRNSREILENIMFKANKILHDASIAIPNGVACSISAHYSIDTFYEYGTVMFDIINREYCKKILVLFPCQKHPVHYHKIKEETFHILSGEMEMNLENDKHLLKVGDLVTVHRGQKHSFTTKTGVVIEEVSTTHIKDDSFYDDETIMKNENRKYEMRFFHVFFEKQNLS